MTPISVSKRSITKCLHCALNACPSMIIHRLFPSKHFKKLRTAVPTNAATICNNYQHVQQRSPWPDRRYWAGIEGPDSVIFSSDLSSAVPMRTDKEHACREQAGCIALWDPPYWAQGQVLVSMLQKRSCTTYCLAGKNTKTSGTENRSREETIGLKGRCSKDLAYGNTGQLSLYLLKAFTEQTD